MLRLRQATSASPARRRPRAAAVLALALVALSLGLGATPSSATVVQTAAITLGDLSATYDGQPHPATATTGVVTTTLPVDATSEAVDTGVDLGPAESVTVTASGTWRVQPSSYAGQPGDYGTFGPYGATSRAGYPTTSEAGTRLPDVATGALIASTDDGSTWQLVGTEHVVTGPGRLLLATNDAHTFY
ncbi:MAG: hypothetical protein JWN17_2701, partial [Frankiales bacterium]|nr:hypothetical protein [Frankiales bacterium]